MANSRVSRRVCVAKIGPLAAPASTKCGRLESGRTESERRTRGRPRDTHSWSGRPTSPKHVRAQMAGGAIPETATGNRDGNLGDSTNGGCHELLVPPSEVIG